MSKLIDLTEQRFGNLIVLEKDESYIKPSGQKATMWKCMCGCGNTISVMTDGSIIFIERIVNGIMMGSLK